MPSGNAIERKTNEIFAIYHCSTVSLKDFGFESTIEKGSNRECRIRHRPVCFEEPECFLARLYVFLVPLHMLLLGGNAGTWSGRSGRKRKWHRR